MPGNQDCLNIDWLVVLQEVSGYRFERFIVSLKRFEKGKFTATEESSFEDSFLFLKVLGQGEQRSYCLGADQASAFNSRSR
ncbi:MAG TPA: hypothetical protein DIW54_14175 [Chitinophagaceae bacterium]|nr:hypothetical protein [Chitinophagaceae bacterium]HCT24399.1 hypothetical protein [Chitinophagaceae bacterium]